MKWLKRILKYFSIIPVQVRRNLESEGFKVEWLPNTRRVTVDGIEIDTSRFILHSDWHYYGLPRYIRKSLKQAKII